MSALEFKLKHALSVREAAALAGRSASWIRTRLNYGGYELLRLPDGRQAVSRAEVQRMLAADDLVRSRRKKRLSRQQPAIRLVWSNPRL
jgi:hypothetical protein